MVQLTPLSRVRKANKLYPVDGDVVVDSKLCNTDMRPVSCSSNSLAGKCARVPQRPGCHAHRLVYHQRVIPDPPDETVLRASLERTLGGVISDAATLQATAAVFDGGLGMRRAADLAAPALIASCVERRPLVRS